MASFEGKAAVLTTDIQVRVLLTSLVLSTYMHDFGFSSMFNIVEALEEHFLQTTLFDL